MVYDLHGGGNCQSKFSIQYGLDILSVQFPDLFDAISLGFPHFLHFIKKLESPALNYVSGDTNGHRRNLKATLAGMSIVLRMSNIGHFALKYDNFMEWNEADCAEKRLASLHGRGGDPTPVWNEQCVRFMNRKVLPLAEECESLLPKGSNLRGLINMNLQKLEALDQGQKPVIPAQDFSGHECQRKNGRSG